MARPSPPPPSLNGLAISGGFIFFAASLTRNLLSVLLPTFFFVKVARVTRAFSDQIYIIGAPLEKVPPNHDRVNGYRREISFCAQENML